MGEALGVDFDVPLEAALGADNFGVDFCGAVGFEGDLGVVLDEFFV